jgi:predicted CoA-binding protein
MAGRIEDIRDFLAQRRIAVVGVSRDPNGTANAIFRKMKSAGSPSLPAPAR